MYRSVVQIYFSVFFSNGFELKFSCNLVQSKSIVFFLFIVQFVRYIAFVFACVVFNIYTVVVF